MILAIDAGNTNVVAACMEHDTVVYGKRYETGKMEADTYHERMLGAFIDEVKQKEGTEQIPTIEGAVIASVVPSINGALRRAVKHCVGWEKLGADLIAGACGAVYKFGCPVIVIDIGTATTFAVVDGQGAYLGGAICPGPYTALKGLTDLAAQLPEEKLEVTDEIIGTNTISCMRIGAFTGHAAMIDGMIDRIMAQMEEKNVKLVATGGPAKEITALCRHKMEYDRDLVLYGLSRLFFRNGA